MTKVIESYNQEDTFSLGVQIGENAMPGLVLTLIGDLGCGKTVFAQGLAKGLGIRDYINSPTFTIVQEYNSGRIPFYHFDVYRIEDPEEMYEVGLDEYLYNDGVCLIEWADMIADMIPKNHTRITIEKDLEKGFDYRRITIYENTCN